MWKSYHMQRLFDLLFAYKSVGDQSVLEARVCKKNLSIYKIYKIRMKYIILNIRAIYSFKWLCG